jgi:hypothetical protein
MADPDLTILILREIRDDVRRLDQRVDRIEARLDDIDQRLSRLERATSSSIRVLRRHDDAIDFLLRRAATSS